MAAMAGTKGYQMINIKATMVDGSSHPVDSSQVAFGSPAAWPSRRRSPRRAWCSLSRS